MLNQFDHPSVACVAAYYYNTFLHGVLHKYMTSHYTKILEVNLFAFAYRLFHEDFSSIDGMLLYKSEHNIGYIIKTVLICLPT